MHVRSRRPCRAEPLEPRRLLAAITPGQTVDGNLSAPYEQDAYTFDANAGTAFVISFAHPAGVSGFQAQMSVFAPDGTRVAYDYTGSQTAAVKLNYTVPAGAGGTYRAVVSDLNLSGSGGGPVTGPYALELVATADPPLDREGNAGLLGNGDTRLGAIHRAGDLDAYTFTADAGDSYLVTLAHATVPTGNSFRGKMFLYGPDGTLQEFRQTDSTTENVVLQGAVRSGTGTYTLLVTDTDESTWTGEYSLQFFNLSPAPVADAEGDGGPLATGGTRFGSFGRLADVDVFTFAAAPGDWFELSLAHTDAGGFHGSLGISPPPGVRWSVTGGVASPTAAMTYRRQVAAGEGGTYTIFARGHFPDGVQVGHYALEFARLPGAQGADHEGHGGAIAPGQTLAAVADRRGDRDVFTFSANPGDQVNVTLDAVDDVLPVMRLYTPSKTAVASSSTVAGGQVTASYTVPAGGGGTFNVVADPGFPSTTAATTGRYTVNLAVKSPDTAPQVTGVFLGSTAWTSAFRSGLASRGEGEAAYGHRINPAEQTRTLGYSNLNQVSVRFSEHVNVAADDLALAGVNVASYGLAATGGFAYDPATFTATWTLNRTIPNDKVTLNLDGDPGTGVTDADGMLLDGEWTNPVHPSTSGDTFPSGNGTAGGDFVFALRVLPGDIDRDGTVNIFDFNVLRPNLNKSGVGMLGGDINGDNIVNIFDFNDFRPYLNKTTPA